MIFKAMNQLSTEMSAGEGLDRKIFYWQLKTSRKKEKEF